MGETRSATYSALLIIVYGFVHAATADEKSPWSYESETGPFYWGELLKDYAMCQYGINQSPIAIFDTTFDRLFTLDFDYRATSFQIAKRNHTIEIDYGAPVKQDKKYVEVAGHKLPLPVIRNYESRLIISGEVYQLQKIQFHAPSEHTFEHKHYAMEVQLVHKNTYDQYAIVAVFLEQGKSNPFIEQLWKNFPTQDIASLEEETPGNATTLLPKNRGYYHYRGSLTTPPCSEGVRWFVLKEPSQLSKAQLQKYSQEFSPNNRPIQPKNYRFLLESL